LPSFEDDSAILCGLKDKLECESYQVFTASDGEAGYRAVRDHTPDLVILDLMLPKLNGYDLCRRVCGEGFNAPILMLSVRSKERRRAPCWASLFGSELPPAPESPPRRSAGAMYSRMCSGPSWSGERWKYCANYTPMLSEHGCERLSHDHPDRLFPTVNYWLTSRGTSWQNAEQCAHLRSQVVDVPSGSLLDDALLGSWSHRLHESFRRCGAQLATNSIR
jgi:CheY-like chemotaxis protein